MRGWLQGQVGGPGGQNVQSPGGLKRSQFRQGFHQSCLHLEGQRHTPLMFGSLMQGQRQVRGGGPFSPKRKVNSPTLGQRQWVWVWRRLGTGWMEVTWGHRRAAATGWDFIGVGWGFFPTLRQRRPAPRISAGTLSSPRIGREILENQRPEESGTALGARRLHARGAKKSVAGNRTPADAVQPQRRRGTQRPRPIC